MRSPREKDLESRIRALISDLGSEDDYVAMQAAAGLREMGEVERAIPELIEALQRDDPFLKRWCAIALCTVGPRARAAVPILLAALAGDYRERCYDPVADVSAAALGKIGAIEAVPVLTRLLDAERRSLRRAAAKALWRIHTADALRPLSGFRRRWREKW